ncbi:MAG: universal stress protein, partial [Gemmatales bacterium]|nr:universal stress protein [Gemmatales bacterium]MDW8174739.1 universal stress protein [Gemmatales bacterium]
MSLPRRILFATDFSPGANQAWQAACHLARAAGAHLIVLHVIPPQVAGYEAVLRGLPVSQYREQAERAMARYSCADLPVEKRFAEGEPAETILRVAAQENADCIVLGTHGYGVLTRMFLGSVAEKVLRKAPGLVLV